MTLKAEEFYGVKQIGAGRVVKICAHCQKPIVKGTTHDVNTFFPDPNVPPDPNVTNPGSLYRNFPTHKECTAAFHQSFV